MMMLTATTAWGQNVTMVPATGGGTYKIVDGTKLYVTPNPGYYLVSVKKADSIEPLQAIAPANGDPYYSISASDNITITFGTCTNNVRVRFNMNGHGTDIYQD